MTVRRKRLRRRLVVAAAVTATGAAMLLLMPTTEERYDRTWSVWAPLLGSVAHPYAGTACDAPGGDALDGTWTRVAARPTDGLSRQFPRARWPLPRFLSRAPRDRWWTYLDSGARWTASDGLSWARLLVVPADEQVVRQGRADPRCVGAWDWTCGDGWTGRLDLRADGSAAAVGRGAGLWGVRDDVLTLLLWRGERGSSADHTVATILAPDFASFRGTERGCRYSAAPWSLVRGRKLRQ